MFPGNKKPEKLNGVPTSGNQGKGTPIGVPQTGETNDKKHKANYGRQNNYSNYNGNQRTSSSSFKPPRKTGTGGESFGVSKPTSSASSSSQSQSQPRPPSQLSGPSTASFSKMKKSTPLVLEDDDENSTMAEDDEKRTKEEPQKMGRKKKKKKEFAWETTDYEDSEEETTAGPSTSKENGGGSWQEKYKTSEEWQTISAGKDLGREAMEGLKLAPGEMDYSGMNASKSEAQKKIEEGRAKREAAKKLAAEKGKEKETERDEIDLLQPNKGSFYNDLSKVKVKKKSPAPDDDGVPEVTLAVEKSGRDQTKKKKKRLLNGDGGGELKHKEKKERKVEEIDVSSSPEKASSSIMSKMRKKSSSSSNKKGRLPSSSPAPEASTSSGNVFDQIKADIKAKAQEEDDEAEFERDIRRKNKAAKREKNGGIDMDLDSSEDESDEDERWRLLEERRRERELEKTLEEMGGDDGDSILMDDAPPPDPTTLCPFCSKLMPSSPSERLISLKAFLLEKPGIRSNPTRKNPLAMRLPITETASFCRRHEEERVIIPHGIEMGWPKKMNWSDFEKRILAETSSHLHDVIQGRTRSDFFELAKEEFEKHGARKMANALSDWGSFDLEQPGYFGPRGFEIMMAKLRKTFVDDNAILRTDLVAPLDPITYIRRVLIPECAVVLIMKDQGCTIERAREIRAESRPYGKAMFNNSKEEEKFILEMETREEEKEEEMKRKKEKREKKERKKAEKARMKAEEAEAEEKALRKAKGKSGKVAKDDSDADNAPRKLPDFFKPKPKRAVESDRPSHQSKVAKTTDSSSPGRNGGWRKNLRESYTDDDDDGMASSSKGRQSKAEIMAESSDIEIMSLEESQKEKENREKKKQKKQRAKSSSESPGKNKHKSHSSALTVTIDSDSD